MTTSAYIQEKFTDLQDRRQLCTFTSEFIDTPTSPLIHSSARIIHVIDGEAIFFLNGREYHIYKDSVISILPWDISIVKDIIEPLTIERYVYNSEFVNGYLRDLFNPKNKRLDFYNNIIEHPVFSLTPNEITSFNHYFRLLQMELNDEGIGRCSDRKLFGDVNIASIIIGILIQFNRCVVYTESKLINEEMELANEILRYIACNLQHKVTLERLSKVFYLSESTIAKYLHENLNYSFSELIAEIRINKAIDLLLYTDMSLKMIAEIVGYTDASHFLKSFDTHFGFTPNDYRKRHRKSGEYIKKREAEVIYPILDYVAENYMDDKISSMVISRKFGISTKALNTIMFFQTEKSFDDYVDWMRISKACELLLTTDLAITDIAIDVGYNTSKTFSRIFSKIRHMTPGSFRKSACMQDELGEIRFNPAIKE